MFPGFIPNIISTKIITVPPAPTICIAGSVVAARSVTVKVKPADHNGGATISSYEAYATPVSTGVSAYRLSAIRCVVLSPVTPFTDYTVNGVRVNNEIGASVPTATWSIKTPADVPDAPAITDVAVVNTTTVTVTFNSPVNNNGSAILRHWATVYNYPALTQYVPANTVATSGRSPGPLQATGGTITVSCLAPGNIYVFRAVAQNSIGYSAESANSAVVTMPIIPGSFTWSNWYAPIAWIVPPGVTSISIVAVGAGGAGKRCAQICSGGGGGGALVYRNNITVIPSNVLTITVGRSNIYYSVVTATSVLKCGSPIILAQTGISTNGFSGGAGGVFSTANLYGGAGGGGSGGAGGGGWCWVGGGGGAAGYAGNGGRGYCVQRLGASAPTAGTGGGGGGGNLGDCGYASGGGGVGLFGQGTSGAAGSNVRTNSGGGGGSGGAQGGQGGCTRRGGPGGGYGGGGGAGRGGGANGGEGAVRIVWPGLGKPVRQFPSTCVGTP